MHDERDDIPDFANKIIWLEMAGAPESRGGILLEHVEFRSYVGRLFLVGRMAQWDVSGWLAGTHAAVAWDAVIHFLVFASREEYQERAAGHKPSLRERMLGRP
jgi:hypothetical protein